jgi:hypothetical protein
LTTEIKERRKRRGPPDGYRTIAALADAGEIGRSTLYRLCKTGELPVHQWRKQIVIADADYRKLVSVQPVQCSADAADAKVRDND